MPRMDLSTEQRQAALWILQQMQYRDKAEIERELSMARLENDIKDFSFGRMMFSIPEDHRRVLGLIFPDLDSPDGKTKTKAWKKFMKDDISKAYRINPKESGNNVKARTFHLNT
jgi:hypothetical protein